MEDLHAITGHNMSLLPPDNFHGQVSGAQQRYTPKQVELTHFFGNSENYVSYSTKDWASTNHAGPVPYNQPDFQFNLWSAGSTQGHLPEASHTPRQLFSQVVNHPYGFSVSQPSNVPAMTVSHPHTVQLKRQSLNSCKDSWVRKANNDTLCRFRSDSCRLSRLVLPTSSRKV